MIEKLCIEAALEITGDNPRLGRDILGLSRQSLYAKLRRYGLANSPGRKRSIRIGEAPVAIAETVLSPTCRLPASWLANCSSRSPGFLHVGIRLPAPFPRA